jgi:F0F1-type ATP synthase assembly protein I
MPQEERERRGLVRLAGLGLELAGAVAGFTLIGWWVDRRFETSPWGVIIGVVLGLVGGMYNLIRSSLAASREVAEREHPSAGPDP